MVLQTKLHTALLLVETFDVFDLDFITPAVFSKLAFPSKLLIERILARVKVLSYTKTRDASPKGCLDKTSAKPIFYLACVQF